MENVKRILITGATGNVGMAVIRSLQRYDSAHTILAAVRDFEKDTIVLERYRVKPVLFDFERRETYKPALAQCDILFLLRPPQLADVKKYFEPLIASAQEAGVQHIVFLSVQGVERSTIIPHHKIEKLIVDSAISYTFLRPAYFMQNFLGNLRADLVNKHRIFLPAGNAKFTLVGVADIGDCAATILTNCERYKNQSFELTCSEKLTFKEMAKKLSDGIGRPILYISPNLLRFYIAKRKAHVPAMLVLVMIMLHFFPRFQPEPSITDCVKRITGHEPATFENFIAENKKSLLG
jgi:uncharacterized protein YbjT (DUF2867 family)